MKDLRYRVILNSPNMPVTTKICLLTLCLGNPCFFQSSCSTFFWLAGFSQTAFFFGVSQKSKKNTKTVGIIKGLNLQPYQGRNTQVFGSMPRFGQAMEFLWIDFSPSEHQDSDLSSFMTCFLTEKKPVIKVRKVGNVDSKAFRFKFAVEEAGTPKRLQVLLFGPFLRFRDILRLHSRSARCFVAAVLQIPNAETG